MKLLIYPINSGSDTHCHPLSLFVVIYLENTLDIRVCIRDKLDKIFQPQFIITYYLYMLGGLFTILLIIEPNLILLKLQAHT